jgi:phage terminase Nu1 subunit (DNA packaging protein)
MQSEDDSDDWLEGEGESSAVASKGEVVTKSRLSAIVGKAQATLDKMIADGAPVMSRGARREGWKIDTAAFIDWMVKRAVGIATGDPDAAGFDSAKRRDKEAQARMREFDLAERAKETINRADAIAIYTEHVGEFRKRLFEMPDQVPGLTDDQRVELEAAIDGALGEFSGLPNPGE